MFKLTTIFSFPDEFRSKVACENDVIQLMCNPYSRIAIYGASYGKTEYESLQCAQPSQASKDESKFVMIISHLLSLYFCNSVFVAFLIYILIPYFFIHT